MELHSPLLEAISKATGESASLADSQPLSGGCINDSRIITLRDGRRYFVKTHPDARRYPGMFKAEFLALQALAKPRVIHVPAPVVHGENFLVTEVFTQGNPAADWQQNMGRQLALLHQASPSQQFGFSCDNYLGTTFQPNPWNEHWSTFWRDQRLAHQLELFRTKTHAADPLLERGERLLARVGQLLAGNQEKPVLLHGDLWSGNASANERGEPVIFDPASYYGSREAEFGMMRLFGGFRPRCEAAYQEVWPFAEGFEERLPLYRLYHELNHLNLFGSAYYSACMTSMGSLL